MQELTGSFRVRDAVRSGVSAGRLRSPHLAAPFHGVRSVVPPADHRELCRAYATKMREDAAFAGLSAARLWGIPLPLAVADDSRVHVSTPHASPRPTGRGVRGTQHDPSRVSLRVTEGLPVFSPVSTWLSLGRLLAFEHLVVAADFLVTAPFGEATEALATVDELRAAVGRFRIPARPLLARAAAFAAVGPLSPPESLCRVLLMSAGIPAPDVNLRIGPLVMFDLAWPEARCALDYLGDHHRTPTQFARDAQRRASIRELGWELIEVTRDELFRHPHQLVVRVRSRLSERGVRVTPVHPSKFVLPSA